MGFYSIFYKEACAYTTSSSYAISIIKNHGFLDGNKRTGFAFMNAFLKINNFRINFFEDETVEKMVKVATSTIKLEELAIWLKSKN